MDTESLKKVVDGLLAEERRLADLLTKVKDTIKSLRKVCPHDWKCTGYDSHKDHYTCKICGEFDSY